MQAFQTKKGVENAYGEGKAKKAKRVIKFRNFYFSASICVVEGAQVYSVQANLQQICLIFSGLIRTSQIIKKKLH